MRSASKDSLTRIPYRGKTISKDRSLSRDKPKDGKISAQAFNLLKVSPTRELFEAKFENYRTNKDLKESQKEKLEQLQRADFDIYTKGEGSPSKQALKMSIGKEKKISVLDERMILDPDQLKKNKTELLLEDKQNQ